MTGSARWVHGLALFVFALAGAGGAAAQSAPTAPPRFPSSANEPDVPEKAGKILNAHRITDAPPEIDGALDEAIWLAADSTSDILQIDPDNLQPMTERTTVRVLYDDQYVYVGAWIYERDPSAIIAGLGRRDQLPPSDIFNFVFDTQHDHTTGYLFGTNPSGVQDDRFFFDDGSQDREYNPIWRVETRIGKDGWTAEFRIPLSQMRYQARGNQAVAWGFDFRREIKRRNEQGEWIARPRGAQGQVSRWGHIVFEEGLGSHRRLEALPFAVARADNPAAAGIQDGYDGGLDIRAGLGRSATLSATFNPDFGQVEADPAVLNLSVFESFFPEKRPFFLEDGSIFVPPYSLLQLFYSRRIGRRPSYLGLQSGDVEIDRPDQTTILGAAKVTGKSGRSTYGLMSALTAPEHAMVDAKADVGGTVRGERMIEPTTSYNVARLQRDFGTGSSFGVLATSVLRDGAPDASAAGVDWRIRWDRNRWIFNGHWAGSRAPLADTMVSGLGGVTNIAFSSRRWFWNGHFHYFSPRFRLGDVGFLRARPDQFNLNTGFGYSQPDPGRLFRNWGLNLNGGVSYNTHGLRNEGYIGVNNNVRLLNYWGGYGYLNWSPPTNDDLETRGGPALRNPEAIRWGLSLFSDSRKTWNFFVGLNGGTDAAGGSSWSTDPGLTLRPSPRVQVSISAGYSYNHDPAQWLTNSDVTGDGVTDNVFGELKSNVVNVTLRSSTAVNRYLTFEAYLQPFVAVGDYTTIKRLARPESFDFEPVAADAISNPDFASRSLRGTFVLRWEYLPGSTIFLVWNVQGSSAVRPGLFDFGSDLGDVFQVPLDNRFQIKASYWLSL